MILLMIAEAVQEQPTNAWETIQYLGTFVFIGFVLWLFMR